MQMYYKVSGEGEPMIMLHGAYMNIPAMGEIVGRLAETHRIYALEFQGHGRTTDIERPIIYPNLAGEVATFMDADGIEKADVFGYSMAGKSTLRRSKPGRSGTASHCSVTDCAKEPADDDAGPSERFFRRQFDILPLRIELKIVRMIDRPGATEIHHCTAKN